MNTVNAFLAREDAAVTVDWVVMAALVIGLAMATFNAIAPSMSDLAENAIESIEIVE